MDPAQTPQMQADSPRRLAVVTGGSRGIGRAIALQLAKDGCGIALVYAGNAQAAGETIEELHALGAPAQAFQCNVADAGQVTEVCKQITSQMGPVEILVNNAGITKDTLLMRMSEEDFTSVINVNLTGAFNMIKALTRTLLRARAGRIVNITSVVGLMGNAGQANYAASKAGLIGLTKSVAREFASRGVTCNAVAPGFIRTAMTDKLGPDVIAQYGKSIPLARLGDAEDVAAVVAFLASPAAGYVTGEVIRTDGGMCM